MMADATMRWSLTPIAPWALESNPVNASITEPKMATTIACVEVD
jgi:hypothetical protein